MELREEPQGDFVVIEADFQRFLTRCAMPEAQVATTVHVNEGAGRETMQASLTVLYDCGLRPNEALHLTWDRVNLGERWLFRGHG